MKYTKVLAVLAIVLAGGLLMACSSGAPQNSSSAASSGKVQKIAASVNITLNEWSLILDTVPMNAGAITIVVKNEGKMKHDLVLTGNGVNAKTKTLEPGETETLTVDLAPGTYNLVCSVPGHSLLGMSSQFTLR